MATSDLSVEFSEITVKIDIKCSPDLNTKIYSVVYFFQVGVLYFLYHT